MGFKWGLVTLIALLLGSINGCALNKLNDYSETMLEHRCPMVRYPAKVGFGAGNLIGLPLVIPSLPVVIVLNSCGVLPIGHEGWDTWYQALTPTYLVATGVESTLAAPGWVAFGWWWPEEKEKKNPVPEPESSPIKSNSPKA